MILGAVDYSMTCPGLCLYDTEFPIAFVNCQFFFMTPVKSLDGQLMKNVQGTYFDKSNYATDIQRFDAISTWAMGHLARADLIGMEGYAMGSKGKVFNIAENTALLKYKMMAANIPYEIFSPKEIKMFAINNSPLDFSGVNKNKIQKEEIYSIFLEETKTDLRTILTPKKSRVDSPVSDIVDSFYICKLLQETSKRGRTDSSQTASE